MRTSTFTDAFKPILKSTKGAQLVDIQGWVDENGESVPKVAERWDDEGNLVRRSEYVTLVFADNCQFNITLKAITYLTTESFDGEPNPDFIPEGILVGKKYSACRDKDGRPVIKPIK